MSDEILDFYNDVPFPNDLSRIPAIESVINGFILPPAWLGDYSHLKILCVGCGTGEELLALNNIFKGASIIGIEPSFSSFKIAVMNSNKHENILVLHESLEEYMQKSNGEYSKFDIIWCNGVLHHMKHQYLFLNRLLQLLDENGRLWLGVYHKAKALYPMETVTNETHRKDHYENPRETLYTFEELHDLVERNKAKINYFAHPIFFTRSKWGRKLADKIFMKVKQPMMYCEVLNV